MACCSALCTDPTGRMLFRALYDVSSDQTLRGGTTSIPSVFCDDIGHTIFKLATTTIADRVERRAEGEYLALLCSIRTNGNSECGVQEPLSASWVGDKMRSRGLAEAETHSSTNLSFRRHSSGRTSLHGESIFGICPIYRTGTVTLDAN